MQLFSIEIHCRRKLCSISVTHHLHKTSRIAALYTKKPPRTPPQWEESSTVFAYRVCCGRDCSCPPQRTTPHFLCFHQLLHLVPCFAIVWIGCFLLDQQFGVFCIQLLDLWQLFHPGFVKGSFRCLVQGDLLPVGFQKLFYCTLTCGRHHRLGGSGIVDDVGFQDSDFGQPRFRRLDGIAQFVIASSCGIHTVLHFLNASDFVLLQEISVLDISFKLYFFAHRA